jgi:hypothetical protein
MSPRDPLDDELDRLLEQARWGEARDEQLARLGDRWRALRRRRVALGYAGLASAAGLLLAAGTLVWQVAPRPGEQVAVQSVPQVPASEHESGAELRNSVATNAAASRDPNRYEQVVLAGVMGPPSPAANVVDAAQIHALIDHLADDPRAPINDDVRAAVKRPGIERRLWKAARGEDPRRRLGAVRLLAEAGSARSIPVLGELVDDPLAHAAAVRGLARLVDDRQLAGLAAAERDAELRRELLAGLAARGSLESTGAYLRFVQNPQLTADALKALVGRNDAPVDALFAYLENPQPAQRAAAARALVSISDPKVIERLSQSLDGVGRHEVLVALLSSPTEQAASLVDRARQNLYLAGAVRAAEQQLHSPIPQRGGNLP